MSQSLRASEPRHRPLAPCPVLPPSLSLTSKPKACPSGPVEESEGLGRVCAPFPREGAQRCQPDVSPTLLHPAVCSTPARTRMDCRSDKQQDLRLDGVRKDRRGDLGLWPLNQRFKPEGIEPERRGSDRICINTLFTSHNHHHRHHHRQYNQHYHHHHTHTNTITTINDAIITSTTTTPSIISAEPDLS